MLRYSKKIIDNLKSADTKTLPAPFPGRFPTRVMIVLHDDKKHPYIGKPFRRVPETLYSYPKAPILVGSLTEFDRKHVIYRTNGGSTELWNYYHPGVNVYLGRKPTFNANKELMRMAFGEGTGTVNDKTLPTRVYWPHCFTILDCIQLAKMALDGLEMRRGKHTEKKGAKKAERAAKKGLGILAEQPAGTTVAFELDNNGHIVEMPVQQHPASLPPGLLGAIQQHVDDFMNVEDNEFYEAPVEEEPEEVD